MNGEPASADCGTTQMRRMLDKLAYEFSDMCLLRRALTHRSASGDHNERLEFLGDAVIELVVTEWLYRSLPEHTEGELTRLRARVVRRESLAAYAREIDLGAAINLGGGELKSGGRHRDSILADGFEALMGALYLDAGLSECSRFLRELLSPRLAELAQAGDAKDPKTRLQEWLQGRGMALPAYEVLRTEGMEHAQRFIVECAVTGTRPVTGSGSSRRRAEQEAARVMLDCLREAAHE